ncbi:uncharacterized protein FOMMEDRAFT_18876 [Fomitiporia mediterranea MF3/22]|uniref:uncharacterized protein n=1 Tax=Fomitiporia mediterranea (strain MF3/22) TaxID=694068 RepID=UPI00044096F2|nr:uncharacterized protein FOMMEDRAFT_18876 [Fomitiporia mediterranea MF3/22]EJD05275.1 hypothetical protein FOMMEDRAFT_18876 [Fomitiporia mediterranea MF3/22]
MLELFLEFLKQELDNESSPSPIFDWGYEVVKLPPPGAFVKTVVESGTPPDISSYDSNAQKDGGSGPSPIIPWTFMPRPTSETGDVTRLVQFSQETTTKLHALCQKKGRTITLRS